MKANFKIKMNFSILIDSNYYYILILWRIWLVFQSLNYRLFQFFKINSQFYPPIYPHNFNRTIFIYF